VGDVGDGDGPGVETAVTDRVPVVGADVGPVVAPHPALADRSIATATTRLTVVRIADPFLLVRHRDSHDWAPPGVQMPAGPRPFGCAAYSSDGRSTWRRCRIGTAAFVVGVNGAD